MQAAMTFAKWASRRIARNNPEHLWMHYAVALSVIFGLLIATHSVNSRIIAKGELASLVIKTSNSQVVSVQKILHLSEEYAQTGASSVGELRKTLARFEVTYASLITSGIWSSDLQNQYFLSSDPLQSMVQNYLSLARQLEPTPPAQRQMILDRMQELYHNGGLSSALEQAANLFEREAESSIADLTQRQYLLLLVSVAALMAEAVLIFLPAQVTVGTALRQLRHKTEVLRLSQIELKNTNYRLEDLINHDALTGLPNRGRLISYLTGLIADSPNSELTLLFVGLDNFKSINDTAGHDFGDGLLLAVANALKNCVDDDDIAARVGGDEFVLVTNEPPDVMAKRLLLSVAEPFSVKGRKLPINASIGYIVSEPGPRDPLSIIANAGIALQAAKNAGGDRAQAFTPNLRDAVEAMQQLQVELRNAIDTGQIEPWFQPQICLATGLLHGAEVLARWRHPTRGLLTPDSFLPAAERAGMIIDLDHAIWKTAMQHACKWQTSGLWRPCISVNAAPDTISDPHLVERFLLQLQRTSLGSDQVVVEVLETTLIDGADDMAAINIDSLAECGISLELDDFGTGYASLSKLTQLPLKGIKLDRSLVAPLPDTGADSVIRAILALALELGLQVIAEGVEEIEQAEHLNERGCALAQGYGFARPMPADEFTEWLATNANRPLRAGGDVVPMVKRA